MHRDLNDTGDRVVAEKTQRKMEVRSREQWEEAEYARGSLRSPRDR